MTTNKTDASLERVKFPHGRHPNSLKNLRPFPKGSNGDHSHNGYSLTSTLKDLLHQESEFIAPHARPKDKLWREQIAREILVKSAQGVVGMVKELLERVDGKVPDRTLPSSVEVTNNFVFILPDGTKVTPRALIEGVNGNSNQDQDD